MAADPPVLSDIPYDDLIVGRRMGPYTENVTREMAEQLAGPIGEWRPVDAAPPAVYPILFLKALRRAMGGIPAGSILAKQELEFHSVLPVDSAVQVTTWIGAKEIRRERRYVTVEFDIRDEGGKPVLSGRKVIVWPA